MCPPGYHRNGIMAARELGHTMYGYIYIYIFNNYPPNTEEDNCISICQISDWFKEFQF